MDNHKSHGVPVRESSDAAMVEMSVERKDISVRLNLFFCCLYGLCNEPMYDEDFLITTPVVFSFFAIKKLNFRESQMIWVAQAEKRRTMDMPPESFESFLKRKLSQEESYFPMFTATFALLISIAFMVDIGLNGRNETPVQSCILERLRANQEWYRLLTNGLMQSKFQELVLTILWFLVCGVYLEFRHGSTKIAFLSIFATSVSIIVNFAVALDSKNVGCWSVSLGWSVAHVLTGMNYADIWINWDMLNIALDKDSRALNSQLHLICFAVGEISPIVGTNFGIFLLGGLPEIAEFENLGNYCLNQNAPGNLAGLFYGFCFALPLFRHMRSSNNVIGTPSRAYCHRLRVVCMVLNTAAIVGFFFALSLLWPSLQPNGAGLSQFENSQSEL